jgi:hypothetical protein
VKRLKGSIWLHRYLHALACADANDPVHYSSRIDGAVMPAANNWDLIDE